MATSRDDIRKYLEYGTLINATHCVIVCDEFDHDDYPVFVTADQSVDDVVKEYDTAPLSHVMEVYNFSLPLEQQVNQERSWNL